MPRNTSWLEKARLRMASCISNSGCRKRELLTAIYRRPKRRQNVEMVFIIEKSILLTLSVGAPNVYNHLLRQEHHPTEYPDPVEAIKFRMEQLGYNQNDLAKHS